MSDKVFCTNCGQQIPADARFCNNCGHPQEPTGIVAPAEPVPAPEPTPVPTPPPVEPPPVTPEPGPSVPPTPPPAGDATGTTPPPAGTTAGTAPPLGDQAREFARQATERVERATPGASDFGRELAAQFTTPGVAAAAIAALGTVALMLVVGLVLAVLPSDDSLFLLEDGSIIEQTLTNAATFTSAPLAFEGEGSTLQRIPAIFVLLPLGGVAVAMAMQRRRLSQLPAAVRLGFGAAAALPLALLLLIVAVAGQFEVGDGSVRPDVSAVFFLALLWGVIGGVAGAAWTLRGAEQPAPGSGALPPIAQRGLRAAAATLRPLLAGLALTTVIGTATIVVQTIRDAGDAKFGRSTPRAVIENAMYAPEHGLHVFELGSFVQFRAAFPAGIGLPIPVEKVDRLFDGGGDEDDEEAGQTFRLFDYSEAVPSWLFILGVLGFIALPMLLALYAGFAAARVGGAGSAAAAAAWGALTGPVWAFFLVILNGVINKTDDFPIWGLADGASVFGFSLLIGSGLGALGGLLALRGRGITPHPAPPAGSHPAG